MAAPKKFPQSKAPASATIYNPVRGVTYTFPLNINSLEWQYEMNSQSFDTIGGRVTQLLSVRITTMQIQGEAGGVNKDDSHGRAALLKLYTNFKQAQDDQNENKVPMVFSVPSRNLKWSVWLKQMQIGWDITTVSYPYSMSLEVEQDFSLVTTQAATTSALDQLSAGVGFNQAWTGLSKTGVSINYSDIVDTIKSMKDSDNTTTASG